MPFSSPQQELYMMINLPELYKEWKHKYGDAPGFKEYMRKHKRRKEKFSKTKNSKRRKHKR
jgi:hypothetical protein